MKKIKNSNPKIQKVVSNTLLSCCHKPKKNFFKVEIEIQTFKRIEISATCAIEYF
jgi:hypothetical protein